MSVSYSQIESYLIEVTEKVAKVLSADKLPEERIYETSKIIKQIEEYYSYMREYEQKLKELKQLANQSKSSLRDYVLEWMIELEEKVFDHDDVRVTIRVYKDRVIVDDEESLPKKYKKTSTKINNKIDKEHLKKDLKSGEDIPKDVAHLEDSLRVCVS